MKITVAHTGPDHKPTAEMKWYAQFTETPDAPLNVYPSYAFGPTPEKALENLMIVFTNFGIAVE